MNSKFNSRILFSSISGSLGAISGLLTFYPLESLKIRIQSSTKEINYIIKKKNISLFKGIKQTLYITAFNGFTYFLLYDYSKSKFQKYLQKDYLITVVASGVSKALQQFMKNPFEVINQQLQLGYEDSWGKVAQSIYKYRGVKGFWQGYSMIICREIPYFSIVFASYEQTKKLLKRNNINYSIGHQIMLGFLSNVLAAALTTPIDVIKTKLMIQRDKTLYKNSFECIKQIYKQNGILGFTKGLGIRSMAGGLSGISFFFVYEQSLKYFSKYF